MLALLFLLTLVLVAIVAPVRGVDSRGLTADGPGPLSLPTMPLLPH
jgi:hypothetical protein